MMEELFGPLELEADYGWQGRRTLAFGGRTQTVDILIHCDGEDAVTPRQEEAFRRFLERWEALQGELLDALLKYYNEEARFSYGPEDPVERARWWPEIKTREALLQAVTLETVVVDWDDLMDKERRVYLLFSRTWGGEDCDGNGIGVCCVNETVREIGYRDMAY